ncbi:MAG: hypothetical protein AMS23_08885 [Bacteroides sp. SM1_62]|nr:MAG: hypothetical protein AMS23_08885 [Bacteroides sp. SM1_62]
MADNNSLRIIDISNPAIPVEKGSIAVDCYEVRVKGNYACVSHEYYLDFQIIDVSDPQNPQVVGHFDHGWYARGLAVEGGNTFLAHGTEGLYVLRETIPPDPPINLTANGASPSPWQNDPDFILNWENPGDMSGISQAKYKIGSQPPTSNTDFNGILQATSPQTVTAVQEGL